MSFLKKIFKAKEGGTMVGNLLRGASNQVSGGLLGNGVMLNAATKKAGVSAAVSKASDIAFAGAMATPEGQKLAGIAAKKGLEYYLETYKMYIVGALLVIAGTFGYLGNSIQQKYKSRKK